jgi:hypothetical protein
MAFVPGPSTTAVTSTGTTTGAGKMVVVQTIGVVSEGAANAWVGVKKDHPGLWAQGIVIGVTLEQAPSNNWVGVPAEGTANDGTDVFTTG